MGRHTHNMYHYTVVPYYTVGHYYGMSGCAMQCDGINYNNDLPVWLLLLCLLQLCRSQHVPPTTHCIFSGQTQRQHWTTAKHRHTHIHTPPCMRRLMIYTCIYTHYIPGHGVTERLKVVLPLMLSVELRCLFLGEGQLLLHGYLKPSLLHLLQHLIWQVTTQRNSLHIQYYGMYTTHMKAIILNSVHRIAYSHWCTKCVYCILHKVCVLGVLHIPIGAQSVCI